VSGEAGELQFLDGLTGLRGWLLDEEVSHVAMEATSSYWLPVWRVLEEGEPFELLLCNARHVKHVPGRKTDVQDASWLAQLCEVGLLHGSFVPPAHIRRLRVATRYRKRLVQLRTPARSSASRRSLRTPWSNSARSPPRR
jgi:transposase